MSSMKAGANRFRATYPVQVSSDSCDWHFRLATFHRTAKRLSEYDNGCDVLRIGVWNIAVT